MADLNTVVWEEILDAVAAGAADLSQLNLHLCAQMPGINVATAVLEKSSASPIMIDTAGLPPEMLSAYMQHYWQVNPWSAFWPRARSGVAYKTTEHFSSALFRNSEFYNDFLLKLDTTEAVAIRLENSESEIITITAMLPERYLGDEEDRLARLFDSVSQKLVSTVRTVRQIAEAQGRSIAAAAIVARSPDMAIVIDTSLHAVAMNGMAEKTAGSGALFQVAHRKLTFADPSLQRWITNTMLDMARGSGLYADQRIVSFRSHYYRLQISRVQENDPRDFAPRLSRKTLALVVIKDLSNSQGGLAQTLSAPIFRLTPGEIRICVSLADGLSVIETAALHALSVHTVRYHLRAIFAKLEISRQSDLLAFLQRLR